MGQYPAFLDRFFTARDAFENVQAVTLRFR